MTQRSDKVREGERQRLRSAEQDTERLRFMRRAAIYHYSAQAATAHRQAYAIPQDGRAVVALAQQSAQEALRNSKIRIAQETNFVLKAERYEFTSTELYRQRGCVMREQAARRVFPERV